VIGVITLDNLSISIVQFNRMENSDLLHLYVHKPGILDTMGYCRNW